MMATHAHQAKATAVPARSVPALPVAGPFAAPGADVSTTTAGLGHDLRNISVSAPVQRVKRGGRVGRKKLAKYLYPKAAPPRQVPQAQPQPVVVPPRIVEPAVEPVTPSRLQPDSEKRGKRQRKKEWRERRARKQEGRSAGPIETLAVSRTKLPLQHDEVVNLPESGTVDPHRIRTTQDTATSRFSGDDAPSVLDTVRELTAYKRNLREARKKGKGKAKGRERSRQAIEPDIPPIGITRQTDPETGEERAFTLDNRRLYAYRRANLPINYRLTEGRAAEDDFQRKYSTRDEGQSLRIVPSESERVPYTHEDLHGEDE